MYREYKTSICWTCSKAAGENGFCSWSKRLIPVEGWTAIKRWYDPKYMSGELKLGYCVLKCPEYVSDKEFQKQKRESK